MQKRILVLGAGEAQLNLIKCAKQLGYYTIVCDMRPDMEGSRIADRYYQQNYMEQNGILEIAVKEKIDGVISNSEPVMINVSYLVDKLGLNGNTEKSVSNLLSKEKFRKLQRENNIFSPRNVTVYDETELEQKAQNIKYPILVKPVESSGTRGMTKLYEYDSEKIRSAYQICHNYSRNGLVEIEEYVEMPKLEVFQADIFLAKGIIFWDGLFTTKRAERMPFVPMTHVFPTLGSQDEILKLKQCVEKIIFASGVSLGEFNVEAYITNAGEVFVIEINARQGGNHIPELINMHTGIDLTKLLVTTSVNDWDYFEFVKGCERENNYIMLHMVFPQKAGKFKGLFIDDEIRKYITDLDVLVEIDEQVSKNDNAEDVLAYIKFKFDDKKGQKKFADNIEEYIYANIE